jgi:hypothetical protein
MLKRRLSVSFLILSWLAGPAPTAAHHSFAAEFDAKKPVKFTGKVTHVEWMNPHAYIYVEAKDEKTGAVIRWAVELGSPTSLTRVGWTRSVLKIEDVVTIEGSQAKYKKDLANARSVLLARTGQKLGAASSQEDSK